MRTLIVVVVVVVVVVMDRDAADLMDDRDGTVR